MTACTHRTRSEHGFSLVELAIASFVSMIVLAGLGAMLISAQRATSFGTSQGTTLDEGRTALSQLQRDLQGSTLFATCPGLQAGSCIIVRTQPVAGGTQDVRYRVTRTRLVRDLGKYTSSSGDFDTVASEVVMKRIDNLRRHVALFDCSGSADALRVTVNVLFRPTSDDASHRLQTVVRPRNAYELPNC